MKYLFASLLVLFLMGTCSYYATDQTKYSAKNVAYASQEVDLPGNMHTTIDSMVEKYCRSNMHVVYGKAMNSKVIESYDSINGANLVSVSQDTLYVLPVDPGLLINKEVDFVSALRSVLHK